jgi:acetone carboxylase gamma subunit
MKDSHLSELILWAVELGCEIAKDLEDKKFTLAEGLALWDNALKIPKLVKNMKHIPDDWQQLKDSPEYTDAIVKQVAEHVSVLSDENAKNIVLQSIKSGIEIGKLIQMCIDAVNK